MELFSITIQGFKRFANETMLRTNGKVLALVGPNEAGKTSVLRAIASLGNEADFSPSDIAREMESDDLEIVGRFFLNEDELAAARLTGPCWLRVHRKAGKKPTCGFDPPAPDRDIEHRVGAIDALMGILDDPEFKAAANESSSDFLEELSDTLEEIRSADPNLSKSLIGKIDSIDTALRNIAENLPKAEEIADRWTQLVELEKAPAPMRNAIDTLWPKVPRILFFDEEARNLASSYLIGTLSSEIPVALKSLFLLGEVDFDKVLAAINSGDSSKLTTLEHRANRKLENSFKAVWRQSGIKVALRFTPAQIDVQIINENSDYTPLAERSDGLRQFVALHAFVSINRADSPILLIDEAEQRLHYDAQADFVQMLTNQKSASKIIYTTHSAGCLPEDLGHGVRLVHPEESDPTLSKITNKFWATSGGGFSPLLMGMGATTMAFFPTRHAVCVEGAADMLLYPSLLRDALGKDTLGYQIVPNLSSAARELAPLVPAKASAIAFLVDGDGGGKTLRDSLVGQGIPTDRVIVLEDADGREFEVEDFVAPHLLVSAANKLLELYHPLAKPLNPINMPDHLRMAYLEKAYKEVSGVKLPKVDLAYELLDMFDADPSLSLVDPDRRALLASIGARIEYAIRL